MDFTLTPEQEALRAAVRDLCARFPDEYWRQTDRDREGDVLQQFDTSRSRALGYFCPIAAGKGIDYSLDTREVLAHAAAEMLAFRG